MYQPNRKQSIQAAVAAADQKLTTSEIIARLETIHDRLDRIVDRLAGDDRLAGSLDDILYDLWSFGLRLSRDAKRQVEAPAVRTLTDGGPDYEDSAEWDALPPIRGGSSEAYQATEQDWEQLADATPEPEVYDLADLTMTADEIAAEIYQAIRDGREQDGPIREADVIRVTGTF